MKRICNEITLKPPIKEIHLFLSNPVKRLIKIAIIVPRSPTLQRAYKLGYSARGLGKS
jgi:hypothetical protein